MSINHILKDTVPDNEKLDVKFRTVEADNLAIANSTFTDLTVSNELTVGGNSTLKDVVSRNLNTTDTLLVGNNLVVNNLIRTENSSVQTNNVLFKSLPFFNSTATGVDHFLTVGELVEGMLIYDDPVKNIFDYRMPYKIDLDNYFGLTGDQQYAFRFNAAIFANIPSNTVLKLTADPDPNSGIFFNYAGTLEKVLSHTVGAEDSYTFICVRQTDGTYIIYG